MAESTVLATAATTPEVASSAALLATLGVRACAPDSLPFLGDDVTAGAETELQAAAIGDAASVDLPQTIRASRYLKNVVRRAGAGDTPTRAVAALERWLDDNPDQVWESAWVRFPESRLSAYARAMFDTDLRADKRDPASPPRSDAARFRPEPAGGAEVRVPVSYLLKLALAEAIAAHGPATGVGAAARPLLDHYLSDNTSPETTSFHLVTAASNRTAGTALAQETARRFLLSELLARYANHRFGLEANGFLRTGRSEVTAARVSLFVDRSRT